MRYSKNAKIMYRKALIGLSLSLSALLLALTPLFVILANQSRTRFGFGGECFIWLLPILALMIILQWEKKDE